MKYFLILSIALLAVGCGMSAAQREELIGKAVNAAGIIARAEASDLLAKAVKEAFDKAIAAGMKPEDAEKLKEKILTEGAAMIDEKVKLAEAKAREEADKRLPPVEESPFGKVLGAILIGLVNAGAGALERKIS